MLPDKDNSKQYKAEDFERYYSGKMTEPEMYALEKAALEDPFLSDAFEGYSYTPAPASDISELKERLQQEKSKSKVIWFGRQQTYHLLKAAAIIIFIAGFSWMIFKKNADQPLKEPELAAKASPLEKDARIQGTVTKADSMLTATSNRIQSDHSLLKVNTIHPGIPSLSVDSTEVAKNESGATAQLQPSSVTKDDKFFQADAKKEEGIAEKSSAANVAGIREQPRNNITGRVVDVDGKPVAFASVMEKGRQTGVIADQDGAFRYNLKDSAAQLIVNAPGYQAATVFATTDSSKHDIVLKGTDNSLSEVVVTNAMGRRKSNSTPSAVSKIVFPRVSVKNAVPLSGWDHFNAYVKDSLRTSTGLNSVPLSGQVMISFNINSKGEPIKIKVKRSLSKACDAEAIRIIRSHTWMLNDPEKKAQAVIQF